MRKRPEIFPFINWLKTVNSKTLRADSLAGLTGAFIVLPQGVAFALIAGLPPIFGLYSAMILPIIAGLFGSSKHLISGPTTAISIVVFASISGLAEPGSQEFIELALLLTLTAGIFQLLFGIARLGALVNFVSHTVVIGFTAGAALLIFVSQLYNLVGLAKPGNIPILEKWYYFIGNVSNFNTGGILVGVLTMMVALVLKRISKRLPNLLIAMILGSLVTYFMNGWIGEIALIGELPRGLPPFSLPAVSGPALQNILPSAFAIALLGLIEAVAIARSIATKSGQHLDSSQEFIGQGLSNIIGSFFSSYAGSGSFTRSGINYDAGAQTPLSGVFAALFLLLIVLFVAPLAAYLPIPVMSGIIMVVAYNLIDWKHMIKIFKSSKRESTVLLITLSATLLLDLEYAIYLGVIFSLVFYLQRTSTPRIVRIAPNPDTPRRRFLWTKKFDLDECPQLLIVRVEGSLFFGSVNHVEGIFREFEEGKETHLLIIGNGINLIDTSGVEFLLNRFKVWEEKGGSVYLSGLKMRARQTLKRNRFYDQVGLEHFFENKETAVRTIVKELNLEKCRNCQVRVFNECP